MRPVVRLIGIILVPCMLILLSGNQVADASVTPAQRQLITSSQNASKEQEKQVLCLARNIYYEAGNENFVGKVAVAQVTINRTKNENFPSSVCGVIGQKTKVKGKTFCQFTWHCKPIPRKQDEVLFRECLHIAKGVMAGHFKAPGVEHALYFHNTSVNPKWKLKRVAKIGNHIFYKPQKMKSV
jgi:N-acetylmuramoyl-L-alanine amidase